MNLSPLSCYTEIMEGKFILWFNEVGKDDIPLVGGKGANLGEMAKFGIPVPAGFIVTAQAYFYFLEKANLRTKIKNYLSSLNLNEPDSLEQVSSHIKRLILTSPVPRDLAQAISENYAKLGTFLKPALVAVRSSATAEDLPTASFAGQQETFLNISGDASVVEKVRQSWASLFTPRAIFYREEQKFDHFKVGIAVPIQKMIQSETSGIMFTIDPLSSDKSKIIIEAIYGLGEMIVQGQVIPDRYEISKKDLKILKKDISTQDKMLVGQKHQNKLLEVPKKIRSLQKIKDREITELGVLGKKIERHYFFPQDIEWAIENEKIYIVQTRPVTTMASVAKGKEEAKDIKLINPKLKPIFTGVGASPGIASGPVREIHSPKEINRVILGDVLVTEMTNPDFVPAMKKAVAIVTDQGGRTAHAAIVSRELGIPCVVGAKIATKLLKTGQVVTVNGETGEVFRGGILQSQKIAHEFKKQDQILAKKHEIPIKTATKIYLNLAEAEKVKDLAKMPVEGVGLLRAEFVMAQIGIHPKKIIHDQKQKMFIEKLASFLATFCEAFSPRPVVYRTSDFKTNEYRNLTGGQDFEPEEQNPMIGYRGAYRYRSDPAVLELELEAIKEVRKKKGFTNLWLMLPFVRTPQELLEVKKIIASAGLLRSPSFKLWLMVEIPANVILLDKFIEMGIDGVSIGSNDLTMLTLGVDRDNAELAQAFNEQDPAVLWELEKIIKTCHQYKITSSICGQAPSDYPSLVEKLVHWGITSVSVNPDAVERTRETIYEEEKKLCRK